MWKNKATVVFGLGLSFAIFFFIQMGLYLINIFCGPAFLDNIFQFCIRIFKKGSIEYYIVLLLVNSYVAYTIFLICKKGLLELINVRKLRKRISLLDNRSLSNELNDRFGREKGDIAVINSNQPIALTFGLLKPTIVLSTTLVEMLEDEELEAVIHHETAHQKNFDTLKVFLLQTISAVMWYIPLTHWAYRNFRIMIELVADEYAIFRMGSELGLGSALLKLIKTHKNIKTPSITVPFADGTVDFRLKQLLEPQQTLPVKLQPKSILISIYAMVFIMILMVIV
jgi:beta-lactamase regulating signal transducer with metallopeptidase domain